MKYYYKKQLRIPIYNAFLKIFFTNDVEKLKNDISYDEININLPGCSYLINDSGQIYIYMVFNFDNFHSPGHGIITHEADHSANFIFNGCGIFADSENDEAHAYLEGWFAETVYEFLFQTIKKTPNYEERLKIYFNKLLLSNKKRIPDPIDLFKSMNS